MKVSCIIRIPLLHLMTCRCLPCIGLVGCVPYDVWSGVCLSDLEVRPRRLNLDRDSSFCCRWVTRTAGTRESRSSDRRRFTSVASLPRSLGTGLCLEILIKRSVFGKDLMYVVVLQAAQGRASRGSRWWDLTLELALTLGTQGTEPASCGRWYQTGKQPSRSELSQISGGRVSSPLSS